ncbi:MAG: DNA adenine methylase [Oscillospiraceae bacterium]|nr:DNA adenine methylase [Oscillospiraceae bacterium]
MKSFIPWIGGKSLLAKKITAEFPQNFGRYIEVFGGGASVLFSADRHAKFEVYNGATGDLVNLFCCLKYHREELQKEIRFYLNSREMFGDIRKQLDCPGFTDIQRAAMFYVQIKISFGADARSYGCSDRAIPVDSFGRVEKRLERVNIEHKDFEDLIKQYDRPDALFYCTPPYHTTEKYYAERFSEADHYRLNSVLTALKGRFLLSYNDDEFVRELYKDFSIQAVSQQNNLSTGQFKEVIIKNY